MLGAAWDAGDEHCFSQCEPTATKYGTGSLWGALPSYISTLACSMFLQHFQRRKEPCNKTVTFALVSHFCCCHLTLKSHRLLTCLQAAAPAGDIAGAAQGAQKPQAVPRSQWLFEPTHGLPIVRKKLKCVRRQLWAMLADMLVRTKALLS